MKKLSFLLLLVLLSSLAFSQDKKMTELKINQLPKSITDFVNKNFPGSTITRAGKIEEKGTLSYIAVVDNKGVKHSYVFDKDGKMVGKGDKILKELNSAPGTTKPSGPSTPANTDPQQGSSTNKKPPVKAEETKSNTKPAATDQAPPKK
jgi:hypothetical protein